MCGEEREGRGLERENKCVGRGSCVNGEREQVKEKQNGLRECVQMTGR